VTIEPIQAGSVVELAYERIRSLIVQGAFAPDKRLNQGELADSFGISRGSVREALHRLVADTLVDFHRNRGFFVAAPLQLDAVVNRLEVRIILEPSIARLAAERRTDQHVLELAEIIRSESSAGSPGEAHDLSREFHILLARATTNTELTRTLEGLWTVDVGRQLLARRSQSPSWQSEDAREHRAILAALERRDGEVAAGLMREHLEAVHAHWSGELSSGESAIHPAD